ncbi:hypothetical protein AURDEDRAFT_113287 [Auricularia subglabra TFB-10046 SS5]|nr:hypothetical protein AURDEDRAFT_113287 [Auricularia subglabra TFB-10046 SS5]
MSEPRDSLPPDIEAAVEAKTPLPPSPPAAEDMSTDDPQPNRKLKRNREVSAEPLTPKPEDVETDPMESRRPPATKRNRLQTIGDDDEPPAQRTSPPRSPPHSPNSLSSSPRHESNLRHMNRGVRKLNVREREGSSRRRARGSKERDNRSSGSGSPRLDDEDTMPLDGPGKPAQASDKSTSSPSSPAAQPVALVPEGSPKARGLATPPSESMDVQSPPAQGPDAAEDAPVEPDAAPAPAPAVSTAHGEDAEMVHEAAAPLSAPDAPHEPRATEEAPAPAAPMDEEPTVPSAEKPAVETPPTTLTKRPRSEEVEEVRPRSPPPPQATLSSTPAKASFGFSAFSNSNPMQVKSNEKPLFGDKSSFKSSASWGSSSDKPSGFAAWASPSGTSAFASPSTLGTSKFTSSFTYKSTSSTPLVFGSSKPPSASTGQKAAAPPPASRTLQGGGFGAYASAARFGSPTPKNRPGTPEGSASSSRERVKKSTNGANDSPDASDDEGGEDHNAAFGKKLQSEAGGAGTSDEDNERKLNLAEQELTTGEEDEETVHQVRAKLFIMETSKGWKERGTGLLKLNVKKADGSSPRLIMRAEGVYRVILNEPFFMGMSFQMQESMRTITFGGAPRDGKSTMYTLRISNIKSVHETFEVLNTHVPTSRKDPPKKEPEPVVESETNTGEDLV